METTLLQKQADFKSGHETDQRFPKRKHTNEQQACEARSTSLVLWDIQIKTAMRYRPTALTMTIIKKTKDAHGQGCTVVARM